jgi:hypothetical protein
VALLLVKDGRIQVDRPAGILVELSILVVRYRSRLVAGRLVPAGGSNRIEGESVDTRGRHNHLLTLSRVYPVPVRWVMDHTATAASVLCR